MDVEKSFDLIKDTEQEHLSSLVDTYSYNLYKLCLNLCNNKLEAEDLFQETWVKVFSKFNNFNNKESFKPWIYAICINSYRDRYRKNKRWLNISFNLFKDENKDLIINNTPSQILSTEALIIKKDENEKLKILINKFARNILGIVIYLLIRNKGGNINAY